MRQPKRGMDPSEYEKVPAYDEWVKGEIFDVKLEENHQFKGKFAKIGDAVRFVFSLEGCEYHHSTGWMTYSYGEKSNLFNKYLKHLVEGAQPDMDFDLDKLKGLAIKTMWSQNGDYDNLEQIRPLRSKVLRVAGATGILPASKAEADRQAAAMKDDPPVEAGADEEHFFA